MSANAEPKKNRIATDDKFFKYKLKLAFKKINSSMSDLFYIAKQRGVSKKDRDSILHDLFNQIGKIQTGYHYYSYNHIQGTIGVATSVFKDEEKHTITSRKKQKTRDDFLRAFNDKISSSNYGLKVLVQHVKDGCGVTFNQFKAIEKIVIPTTWNLTAEEIGDIGGRKILIYAKKHHHDTYKCWRGQYLTYSYSNKNRVYRVVDCFFMKDQSGSVLFCHPEYKLCADGMRRAIGRKISKRIAGKL